MLLWDQPKAALLFVVVSEERIENSEKAALDPDSQAQEEAVVVADFAQCLHSRCMLLWLCLSSSSNLSRNQLFRQLHLVRLLRELQVYREAARAMLVNVQRASKVLGHSAIRFLDPFPVADQYLQTIGETKLRCGLAS